jgi:hypothetical protein
VNILENSLKDFVGKKFVKRYSYKGVKNKRNIYQEKCRQNKQNLLVMIRNRVNISAWA